MFERKPLTFAQRRTEKGQEATSKSRLRIASRRYREGRHRRNNIKAFDDVGFRPRIAAPLPQVRDLKTTVLGVDPSMPIIVSQSGGAGDRSRG
jgi:isopentenyl diphosphate isomerase/L-lactate dehydrogenase-like FMN-dependent dehydrogenase